MALDEGRLQETGQGLPTAFYQRDPLSPPFHANLSGGLRFLQASILLPRHRKHNVDARAGPVRFVLAPAVKKPKRNAPAEQKRPYRSPQKQPNLSQQSLRLLDQLRHCLDQAGAAAQSLLVAGDASLCNRAVPSGARAQRPALPHSRRSPASVHLDATLTDGAS